MFKHTIDTNIAIEASTQKVWDKLLDFSAYPDWNPMIVQLDGEAKVGSKLKFVVRQLNDKLLNLAARFKVVKPARELRWSGGLRGVLYGEHYFVIEKTGEDSCRFHHGEIFSGLLIPIIKLLLEFKGRPLFLALNNAMRARVEGPEKRKFRGFHHVAISTTDVERLKTFYIDQLGFEQVLEHSWPKGTKMADTIQNLEDSSAKLAMLRLGNAYLEMFQYQSPEPILQTSKRRVCDHGITHICLDVTGVDAEYERLKNYGMEFNSEPQWVSPDCRTVYGRDPDGNVVELQELLPTESIMAMP